MARGFSPQAWIAEEKAKRGAAEVAEEDAEIIHVHHADVANPPRPYDFFDWQ